MTDDSTLTNAGAMANDTATHETNNGAVLNGATQQGESAEELRAQILALTARYHRAQWPETEFIAGETPIPVSGKVFDGEDLRYLLDASLDFWLTTGRYGEEFEREFAKFCNVRHALLCNSGSSADLLAFTALTSPVLGDERIRPGDEVITVAAGFPTTVNPIVQHGMVPVFLDIVLPTYDADMSRLEEALSPKTRAIMMAHTLGNPFDLAAVMSFAKKHNLYVVEDNCDALGSTYDGQMTARSAIYQPSAFILRIISRWAKAARF